MSFAFLLPAWTDFNLSPLVEHRGCIAPASYLACERTAPTAIATTYMYVRSDMQAMVYVVHGNMYQSSALRSATLESPTGRDRNAYGEWRVQRTRNQTLTHPGTRDSGLGRPRATKRSILARYYVSFAVRRREAVMPSSGDLLYDLATCDCRCRPFDCPVASPHLQVQLSQQAAFVLSSRCFISRSCRNISVIAECVNNVAEFPATLHSTIFVRPLIFPTLRT